MREISFVSLKVQISSPFLVFLQIIRLLGVKAYRMLVIDTLQRIYLYYQAASDNGDAVLQEANDNIRQYVTDI